MEPPEEFLRLIDLLRPLIFSETALRQVHVFLISLRIHFRVYYDVFHTVQVVILQRFTPVWCRVSVELGRGRSR